MPISPFSLRKAAFATGTVALGLALVAGTGVTAANAAASGVTKLVLVTQQSNVYAGDTVKYQVLGEDDNGNILSNETSNSTITSVNQDDNSADPVVSADSGNSVSITFADPATHIVTARQTGVTSSQIAVAVTPGVATEIRTTPATSSTTLHSTIVFNTKSYDGHGNVRGNATVTYKSSSTHDSVHGSSITFGSYGTRTITVTSKSFTTHATVTVGKKFKPTLHFSGTFALGKTVSSSFTSIPSGTTATRVWKRDGVAISGATGKSYTIVAADQGHSITLVYTLKAKNYIDYTKSSKAHAIA